AALFCLLFVENRKKQSGGKAPHSKKSKAPSRHCGIFFVAVGEKPLIIESDSGSLPRAQLYSNVSVRAAAPATTTVQARARFTFGHVPSGHSER
ncbi:MAG TPA: hypothetical protein VMG10_28790, partial [Gemmataceae bacterium]|nr:hypothetical protein [Gemmataceae bacterium]